MQLYKHLTKIKHNIATKIFRNILKLKIDCQQLKSENTIHVTRKQEIIFFLHQILYM